MFEAKGIYRSYEKGAREVRILNGLEFSCDKGEFIGIYGVSGAGKSTLLHVLGGLDEPDRGSVLFDGQEIYRLKDARLAEFRNRKIGFVFQSYHLLPEFSALENVMLPCLIAGMKRGEARRLADEALEHVGLAERSGHRPSELSGGEQQRAAIARAIVMEPSFILADEPTGNLDEETGLKVFASLQRLYNDTKTGIIMVTHNMDLLKRIPRRMELKGGTLHEA
jgi:lipoprotein-releasing system ATP-binding protein